MPAERAEPAAPVASPPHAHLSPRRRRRAERRGEPAPEALPPERGREARARARHARQLDVMTQQLEMLRNARPTSQRAPVAAPAIAPAPRADGADAAPPKWVPMAHQAVLDAGELSTEQRAHVARLTERIAQRTPGSKRWAETHRSYLADRRNAWGFRLLTKEAQYPIVGQRASGPRFWDIDDNEYVDIPMGFGAMLFGHNPEFVRAALAGALEQGFSSAPNRASPARSPTRSRRRRVTSACTSATPARKP